MPFQLFHDLFPEKAEQETRAITILKQTPIGLPPGQYSFREMFCDERRCDCRRVFFHVVSSLSRRPEAVIAWGWEEPDFYARWLHDDDPEIVAMLKGPCLNVGSPQSKLAPALLTVVQNVFLRDDAYVERVKRHYWSFRAKIDGVPTAKRRAKRRKKKRKRKG